MAENALAPEQKLPKAPPVLPDDEVLYELADLFRVFGDSTRIKILYALHDDELCVQDIANAVTAAIPKIGAFPPVRTVKLIITALIKK